MTLVLNGPLMGRFLPPKMEDYHVTLVSPQCIFFKMCKYYMYCILFHDVYIYDMICVICTVHLKITLI